VKLTVALATGLPLQVTTPLTGVVSYSFDPPPQPGKIKHVSATALKYRNAMSL
jgi:hypothetical protein